MINNYFKHVFVINRKCDIERMKKTHDILVKNNIKYKRFDAVVIKEKVDSHVTNEMLGCGLSHRNIWEYIVHNKLKNVLIFEDDMFLTNDWKVHFKKAIKQLPNEWDIFTLGSFGIKQDSDKYNSPFNFIFYIIVTMLGVYNKKNKQLNDNIVIPYFFTGLYGYAVSYNGAKKLLSLINDINFHIDVLISCKSEQLNIYSLKNDIVYQRIEESTISTNATVNVKQESDLVMTPACQDINYKIHLNILNIIDDKNIKYDYYMNVPVYKLRIGDEPGCNIIINGWFILIVLIIFILVIFT